MRAQVWLKQPLVDLAAINTRHDVVEALVEDPTLRERLRNLHLRGARCKAGVLQEWCFLWRYWAQCLPACSRAHCRMCLKHPTCKLSLLAGGACTPAVLLREPARKFLGGLRIACRLHACAACCSGAGAGALLQGCGWSWRLFNSFIHSSK